MKSKIPVNLVKLEGGFHLLISLKVNGKPSRMLIDTGASHTVFDSTRIKRLLNSEKMESHNKLSTGLGTNDMKSQLVVIGKIVLGKIEVRNYKSVVIDLSHVNVAYSQMKQKPIDGVLGSDILRKYNAVIDYGRKSLKLQVSSRSTAG